MPGDNLALPESPSLVADDSDAAVAYIDDSPLSSDILSALWPPNSDSKRFGETETVAAGRREGDMYDAAIV